MLLLHLRKQAGVIHKVSRYAAEHMLCSGGGGGGVSRPTRTAAAPRVSDREEEKWVWCEDKWMSREER